MRHRARRSSGLLALGALGVVFGDIGTSPLYAFTEIFGGSHDIPVTEDRVFGALSLVFWTLTLIVSVKYVLIVMRADNEGEGGIMALAALAVSAVRRHRSAALIMVFGVIGAALFYGDGMITPAVSVLSAVEGLELVAPGLSSWVVPIALVLLVGLFVVQRYGTGRVGAVFGPVMLVWFIVIGILGLGSLLQSPGVLASIIPTYAVSFIVSDPIMAFLALGSVVLCVTGAEALYADMGQFGRFPIRISWFAVAAPALYLNYLGQGALVLRDPQSVDNSFYLLVPSVLQIPMIVLATVATIIASQAVISGAFSMTQQAIRLGYLPRMTVLHTSAGERGQVYVPFVNWILMVAIIGLVVGFQDSSNLASAYGIAVTGTFVITTCLITVVARHRWNLSWWVVAPVAIVFLIIDGTFFAANLTKFSHGGWFPLVAAAVIFTVLSIWRWGWNRLMERLSYVQAPMSDLEGLLQQPGAIVTPGVMVYVTLEDGVPYALVHRLRIFKVVEDRIIIMRLITTETPRVSPSERLDYAELGEHVSEVKVSYGFMERPQPAVALAELAARVPGIDPETCTYAFYSVHPQVGPSPPLVHLGAEVFAFMQRNAVDPQRYFHLRPDRVVEVGRLVEI
ncbi:MAG: potassium transporter Kup [Actinomycetota bacterium]